MAMPARVCADTKTTALQRSLQLLALPKTRPRPLDVARKGAGIFFGRYFSKKTGRGSTVICKNLFLNWRKSEWRDTFVERDFDMQPCDLKFEMKLFGISDLVFYHFVHSSPECDAIDEMARRCNYHSCKLVIKSCMLTLSEFFSKALLGTRHSGNK